MWYFVGIICGVSRSRVVAVVVVNWYVDRG